MRGFLQMLWQRFRYRITHTSRFPKGDLISFFVNLADRGFKPRHIVDVGANRGKWSREALRIFPDCAFTLIEPQVEMESQLDQFCQRCPNVRWINAGVGADIGELEFTVVPDTVSSSFAYPDDVATAAGYERRIVPVITLDHLVENEIHTVPDLVKIDAEGFEYNIMQGAQSLIGKTEVFLLELPLVEVPEGWHSFSELVTMMADFGYEPYEFTGFIKMKCDSATRLCEIAFARRSGILRGTNQSEVKHAA